MVSPPTYYSTYYVLPFATAYCLLPAACCLLLAPRSPFPAPRSPPTTNHQPPTTAHHPPSTTHLPLPTTSHHPPPTTHHLPPTTHHPPRATLPTLCPDAAVASSGHSGRGSRINPTVPGSSSDDDVSLPSKSNGSVIPLSNSKQSELDRLGSDASDSENLDAINPLESRWGLRMK